MKTRFEPRLPRMSSWKSNKHNTLELNSGPLASEASILPLDHQTRNDQQEWQSSVVLNGTNISLKGTNISFLKFICGTLNRGMANSVWNHVIQISSIRMYFQDIYSNLWKVKLCSGNIYSLKSNTLFWGTVMFIQDGFLYLIVTRHKLTVQEGDLLHCPLAGKSLPVPGWRPFTLPPCREKSSCPRRETFYIAPLLEKVFLSLEGDLYIAPLPGKSSCPRRETFYIATLPEKVFLSLEGDLLH
jgi:hypothetical protein